MSQYNYMSSSKIANLMTRQNQLDPSKEKAYKVTSEKCQTDTELVLVIIPTAVTSQHISGPLDAPQGGSQLGQFRFSPTQDHYVRLLQQILKIFNNKQSPKLYLAIVIDINTLHPAHREWCHNIQWCHLHIVANSTNMQNVLHSIQELQLCAPYYITLPDYVHVDAAFLLRLKTIPTDRVACLLRAPHTSKHSICPGQAFLLPTSFLLHNHAEQEMTPSTVDNNIVVSRALAQGIYAGNFDVVTMFR